MVPIFLVTYVYFSCISYRIFSYQIRKAINHVIGLMMLWSMTSSHLSFAVKFLYPFADVILCPATQGLKLGPHGIVSFQLSHKGLRHFLNRLFETGGRERKNATINDPTRSRFAACALARTSAIIRTLHCATNATGRKRAWPQRRRRQGEANFEDPPITSTPPALSKDWIRGFVSSECLQE